MPSIKFGKLIIYCHQGMQSYTYDPTDKFSPMSCNDAGSPLFIDYCQMICFFRHLSACFSYVWCLLRKRDFCSAVNRILCYNTHHSMSTLDEQAHSVGWCLMEFCSSSCYMQIQWCDAGPIHTTVIITETLKK